MFKSRKEHISVVDECIVELKGRSLFFTVLCLAIFIDSCIYIYHGIYARFVGTGRHANDADQPRFVWYCSRKVLTKAASLTFDMVVSVTNPCCYNRYNYVRAFCQCCCCLYCCTTDDVAANITM